MKTPHEGELEVLSHLKLLIDSYINLLHNGDEDLVDWAIARNNYRKAIDRAVEDWQMCSLPETIP